jgi:hypothetical protein
MHQAAPRHMPGQSLHKLAQVVRSDLRGWLPAQRAPDQQKRTRLAHGRRVPGCRSAGTGGKETARPSSATVLDARRRRPELTVRIPGTSPARGPSPSRSRRPTARTPSPARASSPSRPLAISLIRIPGNSPTRARSHSRPPAFARGRPPSRTSGAASS